MWRSHSSHSENQLGVAAGGANAVGARDVAGAGVRAGLDAACLFAAVDDAAGRAVGRGEDSAAEVCEVVVGSGVMMLTGGVEAALGNSALVGRPVGTPGMRAATGGMAGTAGAAFQPVE